MHVFMFLSHSGVGAAVAHELEIECSLAGIDPAVTGVDMSVTSAE
jgi:hypothetical protein